MSGVFVDYARWYDAIYAGKPYEAEAAKVLAQLRFPSDERRILDLGCGSGRHAIILQGLGCDVVGVDASEAMLALARRNAEVIPTGRLTPRFVHGDVTHLRLPARFDAVVSLFHVASYMVTEESLVSMLRTAHRHLVPSGVIAFDFWNAAADHQTDSTRNLSVSLGDAVLNREARTTRVAEHTFEVRISTALVGEWSEPVPGGVETHTLRSWSASEISHALKEAGFAECRILAWPDLGALGAGDFVGFATARASDRSLIGAA